MNYQKGQISQICLTIYNAFFSNMSGIGAVVKVVDSLCMEFNSQQKLQFSHSLIKQGLITVLHVF